MTCIPPHMREHIFSSRIDTPHSEETLAIHPTLSEDESMLSRDGIPTSYQGDWEPFGTNDSKAKSQIDIDEKALGRYSLPQPVAARPLSSQSTSFSKYYRRFRKILAVIGLVIQVTLIFTGARGLPELLSRQFTEPGLPPSFFSHCNSLLTPPPGTYTGRLDKLVKALSSSPTSTSAKPWVWVAEPGPSAEYFIGSFSSEDWFLSERPFLIAISPSSDQSARITLLTPEFERLRAELIDIPEELEGKISFLPWRESDSPYAVLAEQLGEVVGIVLDPMVRSFVENGLCQAIFRDEGSVRSVEAMKDRDVVDVGVQVGLIRERKDQREIGLLKCANQMTIQAIRKTRKRMHFGITESQTSKILVEEMAKTGLEGGYGLVLFGENAALPHGSGTDRALGRSDFALIDAGGKWGGYVADITRTFALPGSRIPNSHRELWETVREAQQAPYNLLKASNTTTPPKLGELDKAARAVVVSRTREMRMNPSGSEAPDPDFSVFTHRLGHGIGLEGHEQPYLVQGPQGEKEVQVGHVFSLEPGIYLPAASQGQAINGLGIRIEDCFVVSEDEDGNLGGEWLSGPLSAWGDV